MANAQAALRNLADAAGRIAALEGRHAEALKVERNAWAAVEAARAEFDLAREEAIAACPEILRGYGTHETVALVDGELRVIEEDE